MPVPKKSKAMIEVLDPAGAFQLDGDEDDTLAQLLRAEGIPLSSVRTFIWDTTGRMVPVSVSEQLGPHEQKFLALPLRNVALRKRVIKYTTNSEMAGEGLEQDHNGNLIPSPLTREEILATAVSETQKTLNLLHPSKGERHILVGYSGGGDSVLMGAALEQLTDEYESLQLVMISGVRDWDRQIDDAIALGGDHFRVIDVTEVGQRVGVPSIERLFEEFPTLATKWSVLG